MKLLLGSRLQHGAIVITPSQHTNAACLRCISCAAQGVFAHTPLFLAGTQRFAEQLEHAFGLDLIR